MRFSQQFRMIKTPGVHLLWRRQTLRQDSGASGLDSGLDVAPSWLWALDWVTSPVAMTINPTHRGEWPRVPGPPGVKALGKV